MIKLIATDVDGTLIPEGTADVNPELFHIVRGLMSQGIHFVAASGRQYSAILNVFRPMKDEILFIADNGAYIIEKDELLYCNSFPDDIWKEIVTYVQQNPEEKIMLSSVEGSFVAKKNHEFRQQIYDGYGILLEPVSDLTALDVHVTKVGVYCCHGNPKQTAAKAIERFENRAHIVVSGNNWMDYVPIGVDKGKALQRIQKHFGIDVSQTMVFGDNINDIGMLKSAAESYAVANARQEVKDTAKHVLTEGDREDAVLHVLQELYNQYL